MPSDLQDIHGAMGERDLPPVWRRVGQDGTRQLLDHCHAEILHLPAQSPATGQPALRR